MTNKEKLQQKLESLGFTIGCYNSKLDKLSPKELNKIIDNMEYGSTDVGVKLDRKNYVVEVSHVDSEVDFGIITTDQYENKYGRKFA